MCLLVQGDHEGFLSSAYGNFNSEEAQEGSRA